MSQSPLRDSFSTLSTIHLATHLKNEQSHLQHSSVLQITILSSSKNTCWLNHCFYVTPKLSLLIIMCPSFSHLQNRNPSIYPPKDALGIREIMFSVLFEVYLCYLVHKALITSLCYSENVQWLPSTH